MKAGRPSGTRLVWLSGALALALFAAMVVHSSPLSPGIPALQLTFDEAAFKAILAQWGSVGVARFRAHFGIDFAVLGSYGLFGYLLVRHSPLFSQFGAVARRCWSWTLPTAALLDAIENLLHLQLISEAGKHAPALYPLSGCVATGKWLLIASFALAVLYLFVTGRRR